jgi:hypothetical protein|tara:strand:- start:336 stop:977 length:642 start_codon:yes stop_codon:yes gene_type:complete
MKVKIKKKGKKKSFNLITSWADVTLEKWIKIIVAQTETKTKEARETIAAMSDIPKSLIDEMALKDVAVLMGKLGEIQAEKDTELKKIIEIEGQQYAFHPNLDDLTLGEYADIETFIKVGLEKKMPEIMAVLFRPITEREKDVYTIAAYDGKIAIRAEKMKQMSAGQVQSALVFFWRFVINLSKIMPSFLVERTQEIAREWQTKASQQNGDGSE